MNIIGKVKTGVAEFMLGSKIILGKPSPGEGDRKLAKISKIVEAQIPIYGKNVVRKQVVDSIDKDIKRYLKKGDDEAIENMIQNALATPEYTKLMRRLNLEECHIRALVVMAKNKLRGNK